MILGIGIDLIEVERIRRSHEKFREKFLNRFLHPKEIEYCLHRRDPAHFFAARFAAKEAISKAFGTGICSRLGWHDMEIDHKPSGEPIVILRGKGLKLMEERQGREVLVSLSHTKTYATAVAVLEGK